MIYKLRLAGECIHLKLKKRPRSQFDSQSSPQRCSKQSNQRNEGKLGHIAGRSGSKISREVEQIGWE